MNTLDAVVGPLTVVVSLLIKLVGETDQIRRNYARKSALGVSPILYALGLLSYLLWTLHGALTRDWVILTAQAAGVITSAAVLFQMWIYRARKTE